MLDKYTTESLIKVMNLLNYRVSLNSEETKVLQKVMKEVHTRLGQPVGEMHLTVIKGGKDKPMDFI